MFHRVHHIFKRISWCSECIFTLFARPSNGLQWLSTKFANLPTKYARSGRLPISKYMMQHIASRYGSMDSSAYCISRTLSFMGVSCPFPNFRPNCSKIRFPSLDGHTVKMLIARLQDTQAWKLCTGHYVPSFRSSYKNPSYFLLFVFGVKRNLQIITLMCHNQDALWSLLHRKLIMR